MFVTGPTVEPEITTGKTTGAAWALSLASVAITLAGLGIVFSHALDLARPWGGAPPSPVGDPTPIVMVMIIFGSATIFGVVAMLIRVITRLASLAPEPARAAKMEAPILNSPNVAQIPPPINIPSVTEHTTRTFDQRRFSEQNVPE